MSLPAIAASHLFQAAEDCAAEHAVALATACLLSYWLTTRVLSQVHSLSAPDDLVGGLWAVIATTFVYREGHRQSVAAALTRASATSLGFVLS